jgi:hypothetical protein
VATTLTPYLLSSTAASTYQTISGMSAYLSKAGNLAGLTDLATARDNLNLGTLNTPVFAGVTAQGSGLNVSNLTPTSLSMNHTGFGSFVIQPSSGITFPDGTTQTTAFTVAQLSNYLAKSSNLSDLPSASTARTNLGLGSLAVVNDAPSDGSQYARKNGAWDVVSAGADFISSVSSPLAVTTGNLTIDLSAYAPLASPALTGTPTAPTPSPGTDSTRIATTEWVKDFDYAPTNSPHFTGNPKSVTPSTGDDDTSIATTAFVKAQGYITSSALSGYATESFVTSQGYLTDAPSDGNQYARKDGAWDIVSAGSSYITSVTSPLAVTSGDLSIDLSAYATESWVSTNYAPLDNAALTGFPTAPTRATSDNDVNIATTAFVKAQGYLTSAPVTSVAGKTGAVSLVVGDVSGAAPLASPALTGNVTITSNSTGPALFIEQAGTGNILTLHDQASDTTFVAIDQNGKINTIPTVAASAGFNVPHGTTPTSPVNGDIWTTTSGLLARINGFTKTYANYNDASVFSNPNQTLGSSTATGTINVASGATISASTKTVNIGTGGVAGSTTNTTIGPVLGASTTSIGGTTAASTLNLGTGATLTATTKAVNIGTNGASGSTTNILIGSAVGGATSTTTVNGVATFNNNLTVVGPTLDIGNSSSNTTIGLGTGANSSGFTKTVNIGTGATTGTTTITVGSAGGTSTTTLNGTVNATTATAGTSTTQIATTAFVTTANNLKANIASPSLTGTPLSTTAAADTNTTQIATTAFVVGQAGSATPLVNGTAAVGTSLRYARQDHVHGTDTTRAPLASPTFTGVPAAPTATAGTNTTQIATTAFVQAAVSAGSGAVWGSITGTLSSQTDLQSALDAKLSSATAATTYYPLTGNPSGFLTSAPVTSVAGRTGAITLANTDISGLGTMATATAADYSTTSVANGLYYPLSSNPSGYLTSAPVSSVAGRTGAVTLAVADVSGAAPLASPALTGTPTAPTATAGTNTTQIATTAFVAAAIPTNNVKAWVNFNGTGTVSIRASMNVSSITDNGAGDYTMNFTTALADANYAAAGFAGDAAFSLAVTTSSWGTYTQTTSAFRFKVSYGATTIDTTNVHMTIHR